MADRMITIFGGSGFVGRHVVQKLAKTGARIRVAVRRPNQAMFLGPLGDVGQIQLVQANVRNRASIDRAVEGADAVINLVGVLCPKGRQTFGNLHDEGAGAIAAAARAAGADRLIHVSAIGADSEGSAHYARSKAAGEKAVLAAFEGATILRPSVIFGPDDQFLNRFALLARLSPVLPLIGGMPVLSPGGQTKFQPVYVGDVAEAVVKALGDPSAAGKLYELGGPRIYSLREIYEIVLSNIGRRRFFVSLPFPIAKIEAWFFEFWFRFLRPDPPITVDQVRLLENDNVVADNALTLADFGVSPTPIESIAPTYLWRHRPAAHYATLQTD